MHNGALNIHCTQGLQDRPPRTDDLLSNATRLYHFESTDMFNEVIGETFFKTTFFFTKDHGLAHQRAQDKKHHRPYSKRDECDCRRNTECNKEINNEAS